jgi:hypothetical protein
MNVTRGEKENDPQDGQYHIWPHHVNKLEFVRHHDPGTNVATILSQLIETYYD